MTNSTSNISLKLIPQSVPSLCIPRVFSNISRDRIFRIVDDLGLGRILGIDMVPKVSEKGEKYNRIFIHFTAWSTCKDAEKARQIALSGGEFKILYDDPYFWKVSASTSSTTPFAPAAPAPKSASSSRHKLAFDDTAATTVATPPLQQKHQYPSPESRREKYGPRPVTEPRQEPRQEQRQEQRPVRRQEDQRRPKRQEYQKQDHHQSKESKEENSLANVNAAANLLDKLALDMQDDEPQDIKLTINQLNSFYTNDTVLLPPVRRRAGNKGPKKGPVKAVSKPVAVVIEFDETDEVEEGEELA